VLVKFVSPAKIAEPIKMPFGGLVGPRNHILDGGADPQGEGIIFWSKSGGPF